MGARPCERCHAELSAQWARSAHHFASLNNPHYAPAVQDFAHKQGLSGEASALFCARCHDPALINEAGDGLTRLTLDEETTARQDPARAGVGCLLCHSVDEPPPAQGNGLYQLSERPLAFKGAAHRARFASPSLRSAALCGSCHKASLSASITEDRWHRGQDDLDQWSQSAWAGLDPLRPLSEGAPLKSCQGCHMPLVKARLREDAARPSGEVRSHAFLGANASLAHARGDQRHVQDTAEFARGSLRLWLVDGPPPPGAGRSLDLIALNTGAGHRVPGGVNDSNELWLSLEAWDALGRSVLSFGLLPELAEPPPLLRPHNPSAPPLLTSAPRPPNAHLFRAQAVDEQGRPLARRDVTAHRSALFDSSLHPFAPRLLRFTLPPEATRARVRIWMRQHEARYLDYICGALPQPKRAACAEQPTIIMASAAWRADEAHDVYNAHDAHHLYDTTGLSAAWPLGLIYPLALSEAGVEQLRRAQERWASLPRALRLSARGLLVRMMIARGLGQTDELSALAQALESPPYALAAEALPARYWLEASGLMSAFRTAQARYSLEQLWALNPNQRAVARALSMMWGALGLPERSLSFAEALLRLDPESAEGWRLRALASRALGAPEGESEAYEARWLDFRVDEERRDRLRRAWQRRAAQAGELPPLLDELPQYDLRYDLR